MLYGGGTVNKSIHATSIVFITLLTLTLSFASGRNSLQVLPLGDSYTENFEEGVPQTGDSWMLLFERGGQVSLKEVKLEVGDGDPGLGPTTRISYLGADSETEHPIAILKNVPGLKAGPITTVAKDLSITPETFKGSSWKIGANHYLLGGTNKRGSGEDGTHYQFELNCKGKVWTLADQWIDSTGIIPSPTINWAGDLNHDQKLDVLISEGNEHGGWWTLYLSGPESIFPKVAAGFHMA
jgi:hypothetical protein